MTAQAEYRLMSGVL